MVAEGAEEVGPRGLDEVALKDVFDSFEAGLCVIELLYQGEHLVDYRFLATNTSFERQSGLTGARGKRIKEIIPNLEAHWFVAYEKVARTGEPVRIIEEAKALGRWFEVSASRLGGSGSRTLVLLFEDVSRRQQSERVLKDARDRLEATMGAGEVATWIYDVREDALTGDRNLARIFGVSGADAEGGPIAAYLSRIHLEDRERVQALLEASIAGGHRFEQNFGSSATPPYGG